MKAFFVSCLIALPFLATAQPDPLDRVDSLVAAGLDLESTNDFVAAITKYQAAGTLIKAENLGKRYEAQISMFIGYAYYNASNLPEALRYLKQCVHYFELDTNTVRPEYCSVAYHVAALSYFNLNQPVDSLCRYARKAGDSAREVYAADDPLPGLVVLRSFSKAHAMAGLRAGAALGPAELVAPLAPSGGVSAPAQAAAAWALSDDGLALARRRRAAAGAAHAQLAAALAGSPVAAAPGGLPFAWLSSDAETGPALAARLAAAHVYVAPGRLWGDERHVRAALRGPEAIGRLAAALRGEI